MGNLKVGAAKVIITPPIGSSFDAEIYGSTGVLNDIYARSLVFDDGAQKAVLIVCDLLSVRKSLVEGIRKRVTEITGIPPENVMVTATHTHSGALDACSTDPDWVSVLTKLIAGSACAAWKDMKGAKIGTGKGSSLVSVNRRNPMGVIDSEVKVLRIDDMEDNPIVVLVNYASHPNVWGWLIPKINRGFPGYTVDLVEKVIGGNVMAIYLQGTCGNINARRSWDKPVLTSKETGGWQKPPKPQEWPIYVEEERRLGTILGAEAVKVAMDMAEFASYVKISARRREIELPLRKYPLPELCQERVQDKSGLFSYYLSREHLQRIEKSLDMLITEIQAFAINDIAILGLPGEVFVEFGLQINKTSEFKQTFISELANDSICYVPTVKAFEEGGYEPNTSILSPLAGEKLAEEAVKLFKEL